MSLTCGLITVEATLGKQPGKENSWLANYKMPVKKEYISYKSSIYNVVEIFITFET